MSNNTVSHVTVSPTASPSEVTCPMRGVGNEVPLDVGVVRELLRNPVALANCPFAQRAAASESVQAALARAPAAPQEVAAAQHSSTNSVPYHALKFFEAKLQQLKENKHYRTFRYLRRIVGLHPFVRMQIPLAEYEQAVASGLADATPDARVASRVSAAAAGAVHACTRGDACTCTQTPATAAGVSERWVINWCSNDYMNMSHNAEIIVAMHDALDANGAGAGGTRNISGSQTTHVLLERDLARMTGHDAALLFNSCYSANLGVMQALAATLPADTLVLSDAENHASLIQGILASGLAKAVFRHNDVAQLERLLAAEPLERTKLVVFESVYSMSGTVGRIKEILDLCDKYNAISFIDEVHAVGLYGQHGAGLMDAIGERGRATIISGTLGKGFGVTGGFITSAAPIIDCIRSAAPSFIFTGAMSPPLTAGALAAVAHARSPIGDIERRQMRHIASHLKRRVLESGLPLISDESHIVPLRVGRASVCRAIADELLFRHSIYVQPIQYPSVPKGEAMLRFTCSPRHTEADVDHLVAALVPLFAKHGLVGEARVAHVDRSCTRAEQMNA